MVIKDTMKAADLFQSSCSLSGYIMNRVRAQTLEKPEHSRVSEKPPGMQDHYLKVIDTLSEADLGLCSGNGTDVTGLPMMRDGESHVW